MTTQTFSAQALTDVTVTTTTETVALTLPSISTPGAGSQVTIDGALTMTYGTGATAVTVRVRRGTGITGTVVGEGNPLTVSAGNTSEQTFSVVDTPGEVAGQAYVVTVQQTAATANGSVLASAGTITVGP